jgi:hypothetical protein
MKIILVGLGALSLFIGLAPKITAQSVTITVGPATDDSYWVWNDEYQCWIWSGPEFQGDYQGHPFSYWHGRHQGGEDRNHRPGKGESRGEVRPVNRGDGEQPKTEQPRTEIDHSKAEVEKPMAQQSKSEVVKPGAEEKVQPQKPREEERSKAEKPKPEDQKSDSKPKGG